MKSTTAARVLMCVSWLLVAEACPAHNNGEVAPPRIQDRPASGAAAVAPAPAPAATTAASTAQVVLMPPGRDPVTVKVEIADDEGERQKGLMFRKQMATDAGMLFLFEQPQHLTFWMRNTYLPLDMIFIESTKTILGVVENAEPQTDSPRDVPGVAQYVLEVNAGFSREHGLTPGTLVRFEGVDAAAAGGGR